MKFQSALVAIAVVSALASVGTPANAKSVWDQLNESAPRTIFDDLNDTAPRTIFDDIRDTAPVRAPDDDQPVSQP